MKGRYPPLNTLLVFLVASRTKSFTRAAETLFVTRSAVSRQIKSLEEFLGKSLFNRDKTHLTLTEEGSQYANALSLIFADLKVSTDQVMGLSNQSEMILNLSATINATWLMARLPGFEKKHPETTVNFITNSCDTGKEPVDFSSEQLDAAIRLGRGQWENCHIDKLFDVFVPPCAAPSLIEHHSFQETPLLDEYNWLHYSHLPDLWAQWATSAGMPGLKTKKKNIVLDNVAVATQAAVDGLGILPLYRTLSKHLLADNRVMPAHDHLMKKTESYYFLCPLNYENKLPVKTFRDWIVFEAEQFVQP